MMSFFAHHQEEPKQHHSKPCRLFRCCLSLRRRSSYSDSVEEDSVNHTSDVQEMVLVTIRARAMEAKLRRKGNFTKSVRFNSILSPLAGELFVVSKEVQHLDSKQEKQEQEESFFSAGSCLSRCSSGSRDAFFSAGSRLSRCSSSPSSVELWEFPRQSIFQEFCHCEGWPFGLYRKAVLLPPLPKSPSESWTWRKGSKMMKMP